MLGKKFETAKNESFKSEFYIYIGTWKYIHENLKNLSTLDGSSLVPAAAAHFSQVAVCLTSVINQQQ